MIEETDRPVLARSSRSRASRTGSLGKDRMSLGFRFDEGFSEFMFIYAVRLCGVFDECGRKLFYWHFTEGCQLRNIFGGCDV